MTKNPAEEFFDAVDKTANDRKTRELAMLERWKKSGDPEHLEPLLKAYAPVIETKLKQQRATTVQEEAARAHLHTLAIQAFKSYDPSMGAALNTHVDWHLKHFHRYNGQHQNFSRLPEGQARLIGPIQRATTEFQDEFGRDPTHEEIGARLPKPESAKRIGQVLKAQRKDIPASALENDPFSYDSARDGEILSLLPYSLNEEERQVFHHVMGSNGHRKIESTNELAQQLGKSPSQISRIKTRIAQVYEGHRTRR